MDTKTKIIVILLSASILCVGVMAFVGVANPTTQDGQTVIAQVDSSTKTPEPVEMTAIDDAGSDVEMPGMSSDINYNDTPEGQAEMKRLGWEGRDDVQLRPDVKSITQDEIDEHFQQTLENSQQSEIQYDPDYTIDDMECMPNMQYISAFRGMDYVVISSIAAQYAESVGVDPNTVDCDFNPETFMLDTGDYGFVFYCGGKKVTMGYNYLSDQWAGYIYSVEDM